MSDAAPAVDPHAPGRIGTRLLAVGLLGAGALIWFGWYASTKAEDEQNSAVAAATPVSVERIFDDFDRPNGPLETDQEASPVWSVLGTELLITDGNLESTGGDETSIAVTDPGWSDVSVGLVVGNVTPGSGLLFRFVDFNNHWSVVAAPEFATWNLVLTVNGEAVQSWPTGLTGTDSGTRLAVQAQGPEIQVFVNGLPVVRTVDPTFQPATVAGVLATPGAVASFDEFFAIESAVPGA